MIRLFLILLCLAGSMNLGAQHLEVQLDQVKDSQGVLMVGIFTTEKSFMHQPWKGQLVTAKAGVVKVVFDDIPEGEYAVSVIHDANKNGKLDTNFFGVPKEGFGFSNDAMGKFGPPGFEKASIKWRGKGTVIINLRYLL